MDDFAESRMERLKLRVRNRLFWRQYTNSEVAREAGVSTSTVRKFLLEDGRNHTFKVTVAIAYAVGIDLREIELNSPIQANQIVMTKSEEDSVRRYLAERRRKRTRAKAKASARAKAKRK